MPAKSKPKRKPKTQPKSKAKLTKTKPTKTKLAPAITAPQVLTIEPWRKLPWLLHGFSTRPGGLSKGYGAPSLNLGLTQEDKRATVERNREIFLAALGATALGTTGLGAAGLGATGSGAGSSAGRAEPLPLVTLRQIHSDLIHAVSAVPKEQLVGDGMITNTPGLVLAVQTADCLPVIVVDPKKKAVGVFHAGWRGTLARIVEKGVGEMRRHFGCSPRDLQAAIGPGIHKCCFEIGEELRPKFETQFAYASELFHKFEEMDPIREKYPMLFLTARAPGHSELPSQLFLDLVEANRRQLLDAGLTAKNIHISPLCTSCNVDKLFSYRKEKGVTGRMMGAVGIRG